MVAVNFSAEGTGGCIVELVILDADRMLDVTMSEANDILAQRYPEPDLPPFDDTSNDASAGVGGSDRLGEFSGIVIIEPQLVTQADEETNPVWWIRHRDRPGMLVTLAYALSLLDDRSREEAVHAHLAVIRDLVEHERSARGISDRDGDGELHCVACVAEPDIHAELLVDAIALRTRELVDAITLYPMKLVRG